MQLVPQLKDSKKWWIPEVSWICFDGFSELVLSYPPVIYAQVYFFTYIYIYICVCVSSFVHTALKINGWKMRFPLRGMAYFQVCLFQGG